MSDPADLMQAILGPAFSAQEAKRLLEKALCREVDPLHWCAVHLGISPSEIMRRAAAWVGLDFHSIVPRLAPIDINPPRLEALAEVRVFRLRLADRDVAFAAPDFFGILRLKRACRVNPGLRHALYLVPGTALRDLLFEAAGEALIDGARQSLARAWPHAAAQLDLPRPVRWGFAIGLVVLATLVLIAPLLGQIWLLPLWLGVVALPTILRIGALATPTPLPDASDPAMDDADLPLYSILVPLRDEANMVDQLCTSLGRFDYPREKLEIIFVVESRSPETVAAVRRHLDDARFGLAVVPDALPRTKPKALDFALPFCRGEFVVVYDAEDQPDPAQLRRAVARFRREPELECIQARLLIGNGHRGILPALFTGEYAGLFTVMLPAFAQWGVVMPLGGTSNHFRLATLRQLGGWDAYNVTEDADLGVRLARRRLRTATSTSFTMEDAPTSLAPWLGQRTRWMKGWMQTLVVHNRRPLLFRADLGWRNFLLFQVTIIGMLLAPLLHGGFLILLAVTYLRGEWAAAHPDPWYVACLFALLLGHGAAIATNLVGLARTGQRRYWAQQVLLPLYWLLIGWATLRALREFVRQPFHWFKTPHQVAAPPPADQPEAAARPAIDRPS
ncbi:MAG: hypothetical protein ABS76_12875 [Pelagibacterium sp. SCN 64-44]|nr:MAG: hypothetical protein ABS76_12875 [Pelagibacterium sp. SCN 64-44]